MTREEAIKELTDLLPEEFLSEYADVIKIAIEALKQEPCEDCISREAALDDAGLGEFHRYDDYVKMKNYLKSLPPVTPQPKMGRWNFTKHYGRDYYVCSVCGMERMDDHSIGWNYCLNCGAKMQEEVNNGHG